MNHPSRFVVRSTALAVGALLIVAGCGSSDSTSDTVADTATPVEEAVETAVDTTASSDDESAPATAVAEPAETTAATEPAAVATDVAVEAGGSSDAVVLTFDDGRTWTLPKLSCKFDPDATGPAAATINIEGSSDDGAQLIILEAWPFDGSTDRGIPFIGSFVDEDEEVHILLKESAAMADDALEVTGVFYTDVFYQEGDEPNGTYTVRCEP